MRTLFASILLYVVVACGGGGGGCGTIRLAGKFEILTCLLHGDLCLAEPLPGLVRARDRCPLG